MTEATMRGRKNRSMPRITRTTSRGNSGQAPLHPARQNSPAMNRRQAGGSMFPTQSLNSIVRPSTSPSSTLFNMEGMTAVTGMNGQAQAQAQTLQYVQQYHRPNMGGEESHIAQLMRRTQSGNSGVGRRTGAVPNPNFPKTRPSSSHVADEFPTQRPASRGAAGRQLEPLARDMNMAETAMCVEGVQTGEEILIDSQQQHDRVAAESRGADEAGKANKRAQSRKERLLELEVKRLQTLLAQEKKEMAHVKNSYMSLRDQYASLSKVEERIEQLERETREKSDAIGEGRAEQLTLKQQLLDEQKKYLDADASKNEQILDGKNRIIELQERVQRAEKEKKDMGEAWTEAVQQGLEAKERLKDVESSSADNASTISTLKSQQKSREAMISQLKAALAEEASASEKSRRELKEVRDELVSKEAQVIDLRRTADQMTDYITKICQPHFAVVKDESLTPVNLRGFQVTEGHVLVPLLLLLEGYSLLPTQTRTAIDLKSSRLGKGIDYASRSANPHLPSAPAIDVASDYSKDVYNSQYNFDR
eukprot:TRINITY_DN20271_c0_g1_i1.p1 TRINITY_DN20271_c0_g1~~TRINITY_DN20271_c0_g1_i1.p1  ORF type:complete len:535 (+),score=202.41 TRINITY_DN20271_c0_g1_i1:108-1712(+)